MRKGQEHSEETKEKIRLAKLGKTFTTEHSQAISVALKGRKKSAAHKKAISDGIKAAHAKKVAVDAVLGTTPTESSNTVA